MLEGFANTDMIRNRAYEDFVQNLRTNKAVFSYNQAKPPGSLHPEAKTRPHKVGPSTRIQGMIETEIDQTIFE